MNYMHKKEQNLWNVIFTILFLLFVYVLAVILLKKNGSLPTEISLFDLTLVILATFRLIRLFVYDKITQFVRDMFADAERGPAKTLYELLICPWCFGIWCAAVIVFFYYLTPLSWLFILILAVSGAASFIQLLINMVGWRAERLKQKVTKHDD